MLSRNHTTTVARITLVVVAIALASHRSPAAPASRLDARAAAALAAPPSLRYLGAANGAAFVALVSESGVEVVPISTVRPAYRTFGTSSSGRAIAYRALENGMPTGDLIVEHPMKKLPARRVTTRVVISAAWSPTDPALIAYTYAGGEAYGIGLANLRDNTDVVVVEANVIPEHITWSADGARVVYLAADREAAEAEESVSTIGEGEALVPVEARAVWIDTLAPAAAPAAAPGAAALGRGADGVYGFEAVSPNGERRILGDNLLGSGAIRLVGDEGAWRTLATGRLEAVTDSGVVVRSFTDTGAVLVFAPWSGSPETLATTTLTFKLPLASFTISQGGSGYASPGNCNVDNHTGSMAYAYDFRAYDGAHVMASAEGMVVYVRSNVTCNSGTSRCPDYRNPCDSNSGWGNAVIVEHADGSYTKSTHLEPNSVQVLVGTQVCQGRYIGRQGRTGRTIGISTPCGGHLHQQRQSSADINGQSTAVTFASVPSNPLSCGSYQSGASETAGCATTPIIWRFTNAGNFLGFQCINITYASVNSGQLFLDPWGNDPYIISPTFSISGSAMRYVEFYMASNLRDGNASIWFQTSTNQSWSTTRKVSFQANYSNQSGNAPFVCYRINMGSNAQWVNSTITRIRIDPGDNGTGGTSLDTVGFDNIAITP